MFLKNYLFKILPINDKFLQKLSTFFIVMFILILFPTYWRYQMTLNCIFCQTEKTQASVFLPIFEASVTLWFPW